VVVEARWRRTPRRFHRDEVCFSRGLLVGSSTATRITRAFRDAVAETGAPPQPRLQAQTDR
jgi:hypothetical protein